MVKRIIKPGNRQQVHNGTMLFQTAFKEAEVWAPFHIFWTKMEQVLRWRLEKDIQNPSCSSKFTGKVRLQLVTIYAPPHAAHWFKNDSNEELHVIGVNYLEIDEDPEVSE